MLLPCVEELFQSISEQFRKILSFYYEKKYTQKEIAEILGISQQAVSETLKKAKEQLKKYILEMR